MPLIPADVATHPCYVLQREDSVLDQLFREAPQLGQDPQFQRVFREWLTQQDPPEFLLFARRSDGRDVVQPAADLEDLLAYSLPLFLGSFAARGEGCALCLLVLPAVRSRLAGIPMPVARPVAGAYLQPPLPGAPVPLVLTAAAAGTGELSGVLNEMDRALVAGVAAQIPAVGRLLPVGETGPLPLACVRALVRWAPWWVVVVHPSSYIDWLAASAQGPEADLCLGPYILDREALLMGIQVALWEAEGALLSLLTADEQRERWLQQVAQPLAALIPPCLAASEQLLAGRSVALDQVDLLLRAEAALARAVRFALSGAAADGEELRIAARIRPDGTLCFLVLRDIRFVTLILLPAGAWRLCSAPQRRLPHLSQRLAQAMRQLGATRHAQLAAACDLCPELPGLRLIVLGRTAFGQAQALGLPVPLADGGAYAGYVLRDGAPPVLSGQIDAPQELETLVLRWQALPGADVVMPEGYGMPPPVLDALLRAWVSAQASVPS